MPRPKTNHLTTLKRDADGRIHSRWGAFNPVTGEGLPIDAPQEFMDEILQELLQEGEDSGPAEPFDFDAFMEEMRGRKGNDVKSSP